jgi:hypothetical protein
MLRTGIGAQVKTEVKVLGSQGMRGRQRWLSSVHDLLYGLADKADLQCQEQREAQTRTREMHNEASQIIYEAKPEMD